MKVLHAAFFPYPTKGIVNQMLWEKRSAVELDIEWDVKIFCVDDKFNIDVDDIAVYTEAKKKTGTALHFAISWVGLRRRFYKWLDSVSKDYDVVLLRYSSSNPFQWFFLRKVCKPVFLVHHTFELEEIRTKASVSSKIQLALEAFFGKMSIAVSKGSVGVTKEIVDYEANRAGLEGDRVGLLYPNGIYIDNSVIVDRRGSVPELFFVASHFSPWHGLDLLLDSIHLSEKKFVLHLIGSLSAADYKSASADKRIVIHGETGKEEISKISEFCWVGISSLALHRKGMKEACTLKVREYLDSGLPVYANYNDIFPESFEFYRKGPPEIDGIVDYALEMRNVQKKRVSDTSFNYISKKHILENFYLQLLRHYEASH